MIHNILDHIPTGKDNAISADDLASVQGCSKREIRHNIENLRREGVLICSSCKGIGGGYYLPLDSTETAEYFGRQLSRIGNIWRALQPFKKYLNEIPSYDQITLDDLAAKGSDLNG